MKMKQFGLYLILLLLKVDFCNAQLKINTNDRISLNEQWMSHFIESNKFEYSLIAWHTSTWSQSEYTISCLLKQDGKWYLSKIKSSNLGPGNFKQLEVKQSLVNQAELTNLLLSLKPDSAFKRSQKDYDLLPDTCSVVLKDGKRKGVYGVYDAGTVHLTKYDQSGAASRRYYAPDHYLKACYPVTKEYGILSDLINTYDKMWEFTSKWK